MTKSPSKSLKTFAVYSFAHMKFRACEAYWLAEAPNRERLVPQTLTFLVSLAVEGRKS